MKKSTSSIELACLAKEFQSIIDAKVNKIWLMGKKDDKELLIQLHLPSVGKKFLKIKAPDMAYLTDHKLETPDKPHGFCMFLRKRLNNARIRLIEQIDFERILKIVFETKDAKYNFYIELFTPGNFILADENNKIISALDTQKWKDREIRKGLDYICPKLKYNFLKLKKEELTELIKSSDKENIVKTLAIELGLGGMYAEELLFKAGIDKNKTKLSDKDISSLFDIIKDFRKLKLDPILVGSEILPFNIQSFKDIDSIEKKSFKTFNEALDKTLTEHTITEKHEDEKKEAIKFINKEERIVENQEEHIKKLKKQADDNQKIGEAIYHNYQLIDNLLKELKIARQKHSWKEIKKILKEKGHKIIKEINERNNEVVIEI
ncbi:MAG: NFACT family protein [Candidatus Woesearchaeota archaeon]